MSFYLVPEHGFVAISGSGQTSPFWERSISGDVVPWKAPNHNRSSWRYAWDNGEMIRQVAITYAGQSQATAGPELNAKSAEAALKNKYAALGNFQHQVLMAAIT